MEDRGSTAVDTLVMFTTANVNAVQIKWKTGGSTAVDTLAMYTTANVNAVHIDQMPESL